MRVSKEMTSELSDLIDYVNNEKNIAEIQASPEIQDILAQLKRVNKTRINAILKELRSNKKNVPSKTDCLPEYTEADVERIFNSHTSNEIKECYTLKNLQSMYNAIYHDKPSSGKNKDYIINVIGQYYGMSNRAKAFF